MAKKTPEFIFRCIAYQEEDSSYTGVCLDLDIVEESHETLQEAILSIKDAINAHMQTAEKLGFPNELVTRPAPKKYWEKLTKITNAKIRKQSLRSFQFFTTEPHIPGRLYA